MAALDFPSSPSNGQQYVGPGGVTWVYDLPGTKWVAATLAGGVFAPITDAALLGNPTAPTPPAGDADTSIATTAFVTNAVATSLHDVGRNYLHNSMFNVAQRGAGAWTVTSSYTLDRWLAVAINDTISFTQATLADADRAAIGDEAATTALQNVFIGSGTAGSVNVITQRIEDVRRLAGKTVTLSFWAKAAAGTPSLAIRLDQGFGVSGSASVSGAWVTQAISATWARYSVTQTLPSATGKTIGAGSFTVLNLGYSVQGTTPPQSGTIQLWGVQLELGPTATPLEKLDPVTQLQQCYRFYQYRNIILWSYGATGNWIGGSVTLPVTMRATPTTVTFTAGTNSNVGAVTAAGLAPGEVYYYAAITATGAGNINGALIVSADL